MDLKGKNSPDTSSEDIINQCDLYAILLYIYEWTVTNINMITPSSKPIKSPVFSVGPCETYDLQLLLTSTADETVKMEVLLSKDVRITEKKKLKEASCPLTSKLLRNCLSLEFYDGNGKSIGCYACLPYEYKFINTSVVYAWEKEQNISKFVNQNTLTFRAKLSMRFYLNTDEKDQACLNPPTKMLINDMKDFFNERDRFPDIVVKIGGQYVPCHKSVIYSQYPNFAEMVTVPTNPYMAFLELPMYIRNMIDSNCEILHIIPGESSIEAFLSVLHFIYSKQMKIPKTVDDFAVYQCAKNFSVPDLSMILMPTEIKVSSKMKVKKLKYTWYVKNFSSLYDGDSSEIQSPEFKTEVENKIFTWNVVLSYSDQNITLRLRRINGLYEDVQTLYKLGISKADGSTYIGEQFKHLFTQAIVSDFSSVFRNSNSNILSDFLYNDTLVVNCDLTLSVGELSSDIKYCYRSELPVVDLAYWISSLQKLLEKEVFSDATLMVEKEEFRVHRAILAARSPVFARMFESDMKEKRSGCVKIKDASSTVIKQALHYIYTANVDHLTLVQASELYCVADKYEISGLKSICSEFMIQNLDAENACEVLIIADLYGDEKLKATAKDIICSNAAQVLLSSRGIELMSDHSLLAHDILETLSTLYFRSKISQDAVENSHGATSSTKDL